MRGPEPASPRLKRPYGHRARAWVRMLIGSALALGLIAAAGLWLTVRLLAPQAGEWAVPLQLGPMRFSLGVPQLIRLATSPGFAPLLSGRRLQTRWGQVQARWQAERRELALHCAPCSLPVMALGPVPLKLEALTLRVRNDFDRLAGTLDVAAGAHRVTAQWQGRLSASGIDLQLDTGKLPMADAYAVLVPRIPELAHARIDGSVRLRATLQLPSGRMALSPEIVGFEVQGLGTQAWAGARSACGPGAGLRHDDWLVRAVLAAEDQRFHTHAGFDLQELLASFDLNQARRGIRRGASTLNQQLAKLLATGSERHAERKLRELLYAVEMERTLGKSGILQLYLDNVPWGDGLCGAEAAARHYFGRSARSLTPVQAVRLASMLHNPQREAERQAHEGGIDAARIGRIVEGIGAAPGLRARERRVLHASFESTTRADGSITTPASKHPLPSGAP